MKLPGYQLGLELVHTERTAIYRAFRERDGLPVIVKTLSREYPTPAEVRRLELEYRILGKLRGPGVVNALELLRTAGHPALILEDFGADSLAKLPTPLPSGDFLGLAIQAVRALGRIHALQVIHKDIKPHNLLVTPDLRQLKIIDFQLACEISRDRQDISVSHHLEGSLPYISPEQTGRMNRSLDYRSDYYSLGITFFELLTGRLPFEAADVMGWVHCHISRTPPHAHEYQPAIPRMLSNIVHKLLAKEPRQRYQSARGLLADLEACQALHQTGAAGPERPLGTDDVSERFDLSQQLVGREAETRRLMELFELSSQGAGKLLLVSGYAGVGKSSLIRELHKPLTSRHGYFVAGKFDQVDRSIPYGALVQALRALLRQLLTESDQQIQKWRDRILAPLGPGAAVMAELLSELTAIIGPQPAPPPLDPLAAQNRFKFVFAQFIKVLAAAEHPLIIFLDDLQWSDASTPELISDLFISHDVRHLLVIGAYRDNEVHEGHLLNLALRQIRERAPTALVNMPLLPLSEPATAELVAGALKCRPEDCLALAREIHVKTEGNPFFASELLSTLYREGALSFQSEQGRWTWDLDAARRLAASDNVVELMVQRLKRLNEDALGVLRVAACVGNVFSLQSLASLLERSPDTTARMLWPAVAEGLVVPLDDNYRLMHRDPGESLAPAAVEVSYRFQHDRVQQAAYSLITESDRSAMHLRIGRRLLADASDAGQTADAFTVTNHLNLGSSLMLDVGEREALAELNRQAGSQALGATAFDVAAKYYDAGAGCLTPASWAARPQLRFMLFSERISAVLMAGERERAAALCEELFDLAPSKAELGAVFLKKCQVMMYQGKMQEALSAVRQGLTLLGIDFPSDPSAIEQGIGAGIGRMQVHLARVPIEDLLTLPELVDPEKVVAMQLLFQAVPPAIMLYPPLFILAELLMFDLALQHGTTAVSAKNFVDCGMIQGSVLGDYAAAYQLGKVAFRVLDRYDARSLGSQVHFVFAAYVSGWGAPYAEALGSFEEARRLGIETGDHQHLAFSEALHLRMLIHLGRHLDECAAAASATYSLLERISAAIQSDSVRLCQRAIDRLRDTAEDAQTNDRLDTQLTQDILRSGNAQYAFQHGQIQMLVNVLLGDWEAAERWSELTRARLMAAATLLTLPEYHLCECLLTTQWRWPNASEAERPALLQALHQSQEKLRVWSESCPENFAHKYQLCSAEIARVEARPLELVLGLYDAAVTSTGDAFLHLRALSHELHGRYWLERQSPRFAEPLLAEALRMYGHWGAAAKVRRLKREYPHWLNRIRSPSVELGAAPDPGQGTAPALRFDTLQQSVLDLGTVLKATQAISGEVQAERLFARLMDVILENAAAEHGCLILPEEQTGALLVRARADTRGSERDVQRQHPLESETRVCQQMVRYVVRSLEPLVIDDAGVHPEFGSDSYVRAHAIKSVLCMPVLSQGGLVAVLYVENNATTHAFSQERVETLRLIAGQAAISLTNASLYASLERKVEDRTRELGAKTRKMGAMLNGMQQGVFTIDETLRVQPEYSRHLETLVGKTDLVGTHLSQLLFAQSSLRSEVIATNESALRFSFGASLAVANANADHLIKDYQRTLPDGTLQDLELDWNWITGDSSKVDRVLITARDVTLIRRLKQAAAEAAREAGMLSEILDAGVDDFRSFCEMAGGVLREHLARVSSPAGLSPEQRSALFRDVHTLKGHSRMLGLQPIVQAAHAAESASAPEAELVCGPDTPAHKALLTLQSSIDEYERTGQKKLGRFWGNPVRAPSQIRQVAQRTHAVPLDQVLRETARVFPSLARELGKSVPQIEWTDDGTLLDAEWGRVMKDAFVHTFRNSLDHGIETREEREALGKRPEGKIALRTEHDASGVRIHLSDDGRGLPIEQLRSRTGQLNSPDQVVAQAIFDYGVSTARRVSEVSGRGVGMDAVRGYLRELGGDVAIEFTGDAERGHRPFELIFRLPSAATAFPNT
jgi:predicted ATPase/HPt (histidine-containing phosphotransfer) domain-containing protein